MFVLRLLSSFHIPTFFENQGGYFPSSFVGFLRVVGFSDLISWSMSYPLSRVIHIINKTNHQLELFLCFFFLLLHGVEFLIVMSNDH